jgi:hypothetical protein
MRSSTAPRADIREIGGEPLEGSGFEAEEPATSFESRERSAEEGFNQ